MDTTLGPAPGVKRYPTHSIAVVSGIATSTVMLGDKILARSDNTLVVEESGHEPVLYFPPVDVRLDSMQESLSITTCPFKGTARYYSVERGGAHVDIAWQYPSVYNEVRAIAGYVAFYADRVDIKTDGGNEQ